MSVFSPPVKNRVNFRPTPSIRKKSELKKIDNVVEITENPDTYTLKIDESSPYERDIDKDYVESIDEVNGVVEYKTPAEPINVYDIDLKNKSVESKFDSGISKVIKFQFTVKPNNLTHILNEDRLSDFRANYYFQDREITQTELDNLKADIEEIPVKTIHKGDLEDTKTRPITPPTKGGRDWISRGEGNKVTYTITLTQGSRSFAHGRFETGNFSISWSVSSSTDWENGSFSDIGELNGHIELGHIIDDFEGDLSDWTDSTGVTISSDYAYEGSCSITNDSSGNAGTSETFSISQSDTIKFYAYKSGTSGGLYPQLSVGSDRANDTGPYICFRDTGNIEYYDGAWHVLQSYSTGQWYEIKLTDFQMSSAPYTCDVYIDGTKQGENIEFRNDVVVDRFFVDSSNVTYEGYVDWIAHRDSSSGTWTSTIWDSGASSKQQIDTFETSCTIGASENVLVRIGVDTDDDGTIDEWSHASGNGVSCSDGSNTFDDTDFNISAGYRYQVEYYLEVTDSDTTHSPSVESYTLSVIHKRSLSCSSHDGSTMARIGTFGRGLSPDSTHPIGIGRTGAFGRAVSATERDLVSVSYSFLFERDLSTTESDSATVSRSGIWTRSLTVAPKELGEIDRTVDLARSTEADSINSTTVGQQMNYARGLSLIEKSVASISRTLCEIIERALWTSTTHDAGLITKLNGAWRQGFEAPISAAVTAEQGLAVQASKFRVGDVTLHNPLLHVTECYYDNNELILEFVMYAEEPELTDALDTLRSQAEYIDQVERIEVPYGDDIFQDHSQNYKNTVKLKVGSDYLQDRWIGYWQVFQTDFDYERTPDTSAIRVRMRFGVT